MQLSFGPGAVWAIPSVALPTPVRFALAKSSALAISSQIKAARGGSVYARALGRGAVDVKVTLESEAISLRQLSDLFLNGTTSSGQTPTSIDEVGTVAVGTYNVSVANASTFTMDLGVAYQATGKRLTLVSSAPAQGQYAYAAGVYTFNSADVGVKVVISYQFSVAASGNVVTLSNYLQGCPNPFKAVLGRQFQSQQEVITLNNVLADGYDESAGQDAFGSPKLTLQAATDSADILGTVSMAEGA